MFTNWSSYVCLLLSELLLRLFLSFASVGYQLFYQSCTGHFSALLLLLLLPLIFLGKKVAEVVFSHSTSNYGPLARDGMC